LYLKSIKVANRKRNTFFHMLILPVAEYRLKNHHRHHQNHRPGPGH
jgi:hypothetical protein